METRAGKRKAVEEVHRVDPRLSFKVDFESVRDTRSEGLNPLLGGELWVNPKAGVINVRRRDRGFPLCSGLRGRRADLCIEDRCLTLEGLFQVTLRVAEDAGRLRDDLLRMEEPSPSLPLLRSRPMTLAGRREGSTGDEAWNGLGTAQSRRRRSASPRSSVSAGSTTRTPPLKRRVRRL